LLFFWAYEAFNLWDSPRSTAMLVIGYFAAAIIVDGLFKGASFCKYVCPIGQYQFIQSLISPVEVGVRISQFARRVKRMTAFAETTSSADASCNSFQPRKTSNMDCTFCPRLCPRLPAGERLIAGLFAGNSTGPDSAKQET